jgi:hypothetical protein
MRDCSAATYARVGLGCEGCRGVTEAWPLFLVRPMINASRGWRMVETRTAGASPRGPGVAVVCAGSYRRGLIPLRCVRPWCVNSTGTPA